MEDKIKLKYNSSFILCILKKYIKLFLFIFVLTVLCAVVFSSPLFIKSKYKSTLIMFPSASSSISKALLTDQVDVSQDVLQYGEDEQIDRMLQILNSNLIRDRIIEKYDLLNHYNLINHKYKYTKLYKKYKKNIKFKRTEYMAVSVVVLDTDPEYAANIANDIGRLYDTACVLMQKDRANQALYIVEEALRASTHNIKVMEDSLAQLRKLGVNDYESQSEVLNQQLAIELAKMNTKGVKLIQEKLDTLAKYGTPYVSISNQLEHDKMQLSLLKSKLEEAKIDAEQQLTQKFIVSDAFIAEKKSYPIRWLIVFTSVIATFLFTLIVVIIFENLDINANNRE
ncbi:MAG: hypothetical protein ACOX4D_06710 [Bacteroidales bacterium]